MDKGEVPKSEDDGQKPPDSSAMSLSSSQQPSSGSPTPAATSSTATTPAPATAHIMAAPAPTTPKVRKLSGGISTGTKPQPVTISSSPTTTFSSPSVQVVVASKPPFSSSTSGVTLTPEVMANRPPEAMPGAVAIKPASTVGQSSVAIPTLVARDGSPSPQTIVLQTPATSATSSTASSPSAGGATAHIRIPTVPTNLRTGAVLAPKATPTTTIGSRLTLAGNRAILPLSSNPATITTVITTKAAAQLQPQPAHQQVPSLPPTTANVPTNLTSKVGPATVLTASMPNVSGTVATGQQPVSLAIIPQQEGSATKVTVVHAPTLGSSSQTLEIAPKSGMTPMPATVKPQSVTMPVTIRHQASTIKTNLSPGMANSPIQLVPISTGNMARPSPVQPARHALKTTGLRTATPILDSAHSVRVTLLQSPATITKITSTQSGVPSKSATIVGSVGPQGQVRQLAPHNQAATQPTAIRIASLQPAPGGTSGIRSMTVISSPTGGASGTGAVGSAQISVPIPAGAHQQQPPTQVARIITPGGGTRLLSVPSSSLSSVSIQKAFVTTVTTTQQQNNKAASLSQPNVVSLPYGAASITVPKPNVSVSAVPVARVVPQSYGAPSVTTSVTHSSAVSAAAAAYLSRPGQTPIAVSELSLTSVQSGSSGRVAIASAPPVRIASGQDAIARLIPASPSKPGILRRRGDIDRNQLVLGNLTSGAHLSELSITRHPPSGTLSQQLLPQQQQHGEGQDDGSSGSTTVSATSSPCEDGANLSGNEEGVTAVSSAINSQLEPSPRKKPRKQQHVQVRDSQEWDHNGVAKVKAQSASLCPTSPPQPSRPPRPSLLNSYRHTWKSRHNHFLRRSDVRVKEERRPTVNELAAEKRIKQKLDGWKVYHVSAQMEDIVDIEHQLSLRLSSLQKKLEKILASDKEHLSKDLGQVQEVIKANLQRSKVIQAQIRESRDNSIKVFDHKKRVGDILAKYYNKRVVKKREPARL